MDKCVCLVNGVSEGGEQGSGWSVSLRKHRGAAEPIHAGYPRVSTVLTADIAADTHFVTRAPQAKSEQ